MVHTCQHRSIQYSSWYIPVNTGPYNTANVTYLSTPVHTSNGTYLLTPVHTIKLMPNRNQNFEKDTYINNQRPRAWQREMVSPCSKVPRCWADKLSFKSTSALLWLSAPHNYSVILYNGSHHCPSKCKIILMMTEWCYVQYRYWSPTSTSAEIPWC